MNIQTNRLVYSSLTRGGEALNKAVAQALAAHHAGALSLAEYERQADCARGLGVQQVEALRAWHAGAFLSA